MTTSFHDLFSVQKPIIGMIHLAGDSKNERIDRALYELQLYDAENVDGAIIENYDPRTNIDETLEVARKSAKLDLRLVRGLNLLGRSYDSFVEASDAGIPFVQFDSVQPTDLEHQRYGALREIYPEVAVFGGIRFKYTSDTGNPLEKDLKDGMRLCEAIVTTGDGTGMETPLEKLRTFKQHLGTFPLIVGAGVNAENIREQFQYADAAIVGSYFKPNKDPSLPVDRQRVRSLMNVVREIRMG